MEGSLNRLPGSVSMPVQSGRDRRTSRSLASSLNSGFTGGRKSYPCSDNVTDNRLSAISSQREMLHLRPTAGPTRSRGRSANVGAFGSDQPALFQR